MEKLTKEVSHSEEHTDQNKNTFIGRSLERKTIVQHITNWMELQEDDCGDIDEPNRILQINGAPGIGKSTLMEKVVEELKIHVAGHDLSLAYHYINLAGLSDIVTVKNKLMLTRKLAQVQDAPDTPYDLHLVVFDQVEAVAGTGDRKLQTDFQLLCEEMVIESGNILVVLISRFHLKFLSLGKICYDVKLPPLSSDDSQHLIKCLVPEIHIDEEELRTLVELCEGIPLALVLSARILQNHVMTSHELCSSLNKSQVCTLDQVKADTEHGLEGVVKTAVSHLTDILKEYYVTLGYFPSDFGVDAAAHVLGKESTAFAKQDALLPLRKRSLLSIETRNAQQRVTIHAFLRHFMEEQYSGLRNEELTRDRYCEFYALLVQRLAPLVEANNCKKLPLFIQEIHNIEKLLKEAVNCSQEHYNLFIKLAYHAEYLLTNFFGKEAIRFYEACVNSAAVYAEAHDDARNLGLMWSSYGQVLGFIGNNFDAAYTAYMKSLEILEPLGDSEDLAWLYSHIGFNFHDRGMEKEAIERFDVALAMFRRVLEKVKIQEKEYSLEGKNAPENLKRRPIRTERLMCGTLASLGIVHCCIGNWKLSEKYSSESLERRQRMWGLHPVIGAMYNNISYVYQSLGDPRGFEYACKGLETKMRFDERPSNTNIASLCNVAMQHCSHDNSVEAMKYTEKAYFMVKRMGLDHNNASLVYTCLGEVHTLSGHFEEALEWHKKAVAHRKEHLGPKHQFTAEALHCLGNTLIKSGRSEEALKELNECLEIRKEVAKNMPNLDVGIVGVEESKANAYMEVGDKKKAKKHYGLAIAESQRLQDIYEDKKEITVKIDKTKAEIERLKELQICVETGREPIIMSANVQPLNIFSLSW
ncbi:nephrocystin-3-like [Ptychodera flava]|uniref:nephrocystin-3-like n=1 Tax=Ptychodera flava TaxID=63121 RepID=UPI00396A134B